MKTQNSSLKSVLLGERWKAHPYHKGLIVSSYGRVIGVSGFLLKPKKYKNGYVCVAYSWKANPRHLLVHSLVLETFVGKRPKGYVAAHLDGTRDNNVVGNLCWCTQKENMSHMVIHGTSNRGTKNHFAVLNEAKVRAIRMSFDGDASGFAKLYGVSKTMILAICAGEYWKNVSPQKSIHKPTK